MPSIVVEATTTAITGKKITRARALEIAENPRKISFKLSRLIASESSRSRRAGTLNQAMTAAISKSAEEPTIVAVMFQVAKKAPTGGATIEQNEPIPTIEADALDGVIPGAFGSSLNSAALVRFPAAPLSTLMATIVTGCGKNAMTATQSEDTAREPDQQARPEKRSATQPVKGPQSMPVKNPPTAMTVSHQGSAMREI